MASQMHYLKTKTNPEFGTMSKIGISYRGLLKEDPPSGFGYFHSCLMVTLNNEHFIMDTGFGRRSPRLASFYCCIVRCSLPPTTHKLSNPVHCGATSIQDVVLLSQSPSASSQGTPSASPSPRLRMSSAARARGEKPDGRPAGQ